MRPPRQLRKDAALKRSATTLAMRTHAAGLRHMLLVSFEGDEFDQALAHAVSAERARALRGMRVSRVRRPAAPSASASAATAAAWLAGAIIPSSRRNIGADMFVVPESLVSFAPVRLTADAQSQLRPWAEALHRCALVYSAQGGLELEARVSFRVGDSVIRGYVDCEVFDDASAVVSGGTLLGPLSYLNSACGANSLARSSAGRQQKRLHLTACDIGTWDITHMEPQPKWMALCLSWAFFSLIDNRPRRARAGAARKRATPSPC